MGLTVKQPSRKMPQRIIFFLIGSDDLSRIGMGMSMIIMSDETLRTRSGTHKSLSAPSSHTNQVVLVPST